MTRAVARYPHCIASSGAAGGDAVVPDFEEAWAYPSTAAMQANPNTWFDADEHSPESIAAGDGVSLTTGILDAPWSLGVSANACRTTFNARDPNDGGGESLYGKNITWSLKPIGITRQLWCQWYFRTSSNWKTDFLLNGSPFDHKSMFYQHNSGSGRWETKFGKLGSNPGGDIKCQLEVVMENYQRGSTGEPSVARVPPMTTTVTNGVIVPAAPFWTGTWHRVFAHLEIESTPGANDGVYELWLDGFKVMDQQPINTGATVSGGGFTGLNLGRNLNQIPDQTQWWEFGRIRAWKTDPGLH